MASRAATFAIGNPVAFDASGGADVVYLGGDATFTFGAGHGLASVDTASSTGGDRIIFENLNSSDARVRRDDEADGDWTIMFLSTGDQLTLLTAVSGATTPTTRPKKTRSLSSPTTNCAMR